MMNKIYPRKGDTQTVYLNAVVKDPSIEIGDYTIYNDFVSDPCLFEQNNVLYHYPINHERADNWKVLFYCLRRKISVQLCQPYPKIFIHLHISAVL